MHSNPIVHTRVTLAFSSLTLPYQGGELAIPLGKATVYTQVILNSIYGCVTPSNSPLVKGRTRVSPLTKGGLRGIMQAFELPFEMCVYRSLGKKRLRR